MKNTHITSLKEELPIEIRLEVYKEALDNITNLSTSYTYDLGDNRSLCLLIPCILWGLDTYLNNAPNKEDWSFNDTSIAFPECSKKVRDSINSLYTNPDSNIPERNKLRIEYLNKWIKDLSEKLSNQ